MRSRRPRQPKKPPTLPYELLERGGTDQPVYDRLDYLLEQHHDELGPVKIALAWATKWTLDPDGNQRLGQCRRASTLDRELHEWDFVILLNKPWYQHQAVTDIQRDALLDHELHHCAVRDDKHTGEPAARYGLWKRDLEKFAQALKRGMEQVTLPLEDKPAERAGAVH
jgi:hypothetical protein